MDWKNTLFVILATSLPWFVVTSYFWLKLSKVYMNEQLITGLIQKLAKAEGEKRILKAALSKEHEDNKRLMSEKLKKWNIPDYI
jgi:hypothetical protein